MSHGDSRQGPRQSPDDAGEPDPRSLPHATIEDQIAEMENEGQAQDPGTEGTPTDQPGHEGATEKDVGDRTGPGAGYDSEPEQEEDRGGVA